MKVLLHGIQKNHYTYTGFSDNLGAKNITSYLPRNYYVRYNDTADIYESGSLIKGIEKYDLIVFSPRSFIDRNFTNILNSGTSAPKIFIDNEDDFFIRRIYNHKEIKLYYKRELYSRLEPGYVTEWLFRYLYGGYLFEPFNDKASLAKSWSHLALPSGFAVKSGKLKKLFSYPITVEPKKIPEMKKSNDLFFCMPLKEVGDRRTYYKALTELQAELSSTVMVLKTGGMPKLEYLKSLKSAKCSVSIRGGGYDSDRYWEIPCYGSALLAQRMPLAIENNFIDGESALMFDSKEELRQKFKKYVLDSSEWKEIAKKGQKLYFAHHTPQKRVKELILNRLYT